MKKTSLLMINLIAKGMQRKIPYQQLMENKSLRRDLCEVAYNWRHVYMKQPTGSIKRMGNDRELVNNPEFFINNITCIRSMCKKFIYYLHYGEKNLRQRKHSSKRTRSYRQ